MINRAGILSDYGHMLREYSVTGILDKEILFKLRDVLGVSFIIQPKLVDFVQRDSTRLGLLGLNILKAQEARAKIYIELWSTNTGEILWVGLGDATIAVEDVRAKPISFEEVTQFVIETIIQKLP